MSFLTEPSRAGRTSPLRIKPLKYNAGWYREDDSPLSDGFGQGLLYLFFMIPSETSAMISLDIQGSKGSKVTFGLMKIASVAQ